MQPELVELAHRVRLDVDADAELLELGDGFEQAQPVAALAQEQSRRKPPDPRAGDDDVHLIQVDPAVGSWQPWGTVFPARRWGEPCPSS